MNSNLEFLLPVPEDKDDPEVKKIRAKLLSRLDHTLNEYLSQNHEEVKEIRWLQRKRIFANIFNKIVQLIEKWLWTIWEMVDGALEAYDSFPDKLREKFKHSIHSTFRNDRATSNGNTILLIIFAAVCIGLLSMHCSHAQVIIIMR